MEPGLTYAAARGTSSLLVFRDRVYLGFGGTGASRPTYLVLRKMPSSPGSTPTGGDLTNLRINDVSGRVAQLRAMGYRIAVDDLGAGYAGLTSFAQLEPEVVKVDMSLIRGLDRSPTKQKLVHSIVGLCRGLGIQMIAEGIETEEERDTLVNLGGDLCQGYLFARPGRAFPPIKI